jgi:hypothetical protein
MVNRILTMKYKFRGKPVYIKGSYVYDSITNEWMGHMFEDENGIKHVLGPRCKGQLDPVCNDVTTGEAAFQIAVHVTVFKS